ncbi:MAG: hydroxymethylglutaryl-CoA synthase [Miltoncostaeaceae bacterium]|nr:hydroxymethylglutaryl-CoA synthase [Miltoncostaeaceae bacterium]
MAELISYGAYLPRYRAPLGELHRFYGRPGRPRSRTLATPGLDEDPLTMAYEAAVEALGEGAAPTTLIAVCQSPPFGLRKLSGTLRVALGLGAEVTPYDLGGHAGGLMDAFALAGALAADGAGQALVVATDHLVSYEERVADTLSAGGAAAFLVGASGGFAALGPAARGYREVYDVWRLGTEPEPRYRLEVLFDAYAAAAKEAFAGLQALTERPAGEYAAVCASQPHPQALRALGRLGVRPEQLESTSFVGEIGNLGAASVGLALALGLDRAEPGQELLCFGYGGGEGIAQALSVTGAPPAIGAAERIAGDEIALGTYYRWTRGRQPEPH